MSYDSAKEQNLKYFNALLAESTDEHRVVAQSKISHLKRFEKLLELGDFNNKSVLDVGCGIGGFADFLRAKGIVCDFTGIDIVPGMIDIAQKNHPDIKHKFYTFDIVENELAGSFDYVVSNGPLNLRFDGSVNMESTMRMIRAMYRLSSLGAAITMTSAYTRKPDPHTYYYNPVEVIAEASSFCTNLRFDHTYLPHDFALFLYKKDLYSF